MLSHEHRFLPGKWVKRLASYMDNLRVLLIDSLWLEVSLINTSHVYVNTVNTYMPSTGSALTSYYESFRVEILVTLRYSMSLK